MKKREFYLRQAAQCLRLSKSVSDPEAAGLLSHLAQHFLRKAEPGKRIKRKRAK